MSNFIKAVEHQARKPVTVERTTRDSLLIEGVEYAGELFRTFAEPDDKYLYAIRRDGEVVTLTVVHNIEEAEKFFMEVEG